VRGDAARGAETARSPSHNLSIGEALRNIAPPEDLIICPALSSYCIENPCWGRTAIGGAGRPRRGQQHNRSSSHPFATETRSSETTFQPYPFDRSDFECKYRYTQTARPIHVATAPYPDELRVVIQDNLFPCSKAYSRVVGGDGAGDLRSGCEFARSRPLPTPTDPSNILLQSQDSNQSSFN
jgi:hypothetical protein